VDSGFFQPVTSFMQAAADDLGISLEVVYSQRNHIRMIEEGNKILARKKLPQYLVLINERNVIPQILEKADQLGVNTIVFNEGLMDEDLQRFTTGSNALKYFVGQVVPNDYQAGKVLAQSLINRAIKQKRVADDGQIHMFGINGSRNTTSPILREKGLRATVKEYDNVVLHQVPHAYWEKEKAKVITKGLLARYPQTTIIWAASDDMALGASEAISEAGFVPGQDILTGGIDWASFVFAKVADNTLSASVGGHTFDGAWVMVLIHDHFHKVFESFRLEQTDFFVMTPENVSQYQDVMDQSRWSDIDFTRFSKFENPSISSYDFGVGLILQDWKK
jgi:ABC-type sugar transport system substrate-binding protein